MRVLAYGYQSRPLVGRIVRRLRRPDFALIFVPEGDFDGILPAVIPLAPQSAELAVGDELFSAGCAGGDWPTQWHGHLLKQDGEGLHFVPAPAGGRSGSAIFDGEARYVVGILVARAGDNSEGLAVPLSDVYRAFAAASASSSGGGKSSLHLVATASEPADCPGGCCPNGTCPSAGCPDGNCPGASPWPSHLLPLRKHSEPPPPKMDLVPIEQELGRIAGLVEGMKSAPAPLAPPWAPLTDPLAEQKADAAMNAAQDAGRKVDDLAGQIKPLGQQVEKIEKSVEATGELIARHGTLPEQFAAAKMKVAADDPEAGRAKQDMEALKMMVSQHRTIGIVLVVVGLVAIAVIHTIRTGQGPLKEILDKLSAAQPQNRATGEPCVASRRVRCQTRRSRASGGPDRCRGRRRSPRRSGGRHRGCGRTRESRCRSVPGSKSGESS